MGNDLRTIGIFIFRSAILLALAGLFSCVNSDILPYNESDDTILVNNRLKLTGTICNQEPGDTLLPVKILFVLDNSGSLNGEGGGGTDPDRADGTNLRQDAVRAVVDQFGANPAYWFGQIQFSGAYSNIEGLDVCMDTTSPGVDFGMEFTQDEAQYISTCVDTINTPGSYTPMYSSLVKAYDEIYEDLSLAGATEAARTTYIVILLTDGVPDDGIGDCDNVNCCNPAIHPDGVVPYDLEGNCMCPGQPDRAENPENIYQTVNDIMRLQSEDAEIRAKEITVNTVFLLRENRTDPLSKAGGCYDLDTEPEVIEYAQELLQNIASMGDGRYLEYDSDVLIDPENPENPQGALDFVQLITTDVKSVFGIKSFVVANLNARLSGSGELLADSDKDGFSDQYELERGMDPSNADSDGDGLGDKIETILGKDWNNPNDSTCGSDPSDFLDTDFDGLNDCEERAMETDEKVADSDADGYIDFLEIVYDTDPLSFDSNGDNNQDGVNNGQEISLHLEPNLKIDSDKAERLAYRYDFIYDEEKPIDDIGDYLKRCLDFEVSNISLVKPISQPGLPSGLNDILIYYIETLNDNHEEFGTLTIGHYNAIYIGSGYKYPQSGTLEIDFDDFNIWGKILGFDGGLYELP